MPSPSDRSIRISDRVGNSRTNRPGDVLWAKDALACLGRYSCAGKERHNLIDRELDQAIRYYQRDRGLRQDGFMQPGGETEATLWVEIARLAQRASQ